ncbi:MAG: FN3 associated domain-containing protein, partial [Chitinophagaceae bacterium]
MQKIGKVAEGILLGSFFFLIFILLFQQYIVLPDWLKVAGRMHPMFLHFPIVLLFISMLGWWITPSEQYKEWPKYLLLVAALSAVITALMGLLLSMEEVREGSTFQWHKWSGIAIGFLAILSYYFYTYLSLKRRSGKALSILCCVLIIAAGHWGATLTHGSNYLMAPITVVRKVPIDKAIVFADVIQPVFAAKCFSCHGEGNLKGGLNLETIRGILDGGKTGPLFTIGDPGLSLLMHRVLLPSNEKKHMPPISRPQLSEEEILLLAAWIRSGSLTDKKLISLPVQDTFRILASAWLRGSETEQDEPQYSFVSADPKKIQQLNNNYRVIEQLGEKSPALSVRFYGREAYTSTALKDLLALRLQITEINLSKMPVSDNDLATLADMPNLNRINLNYTLISDKGLEQLIKLKNLQDISLSGTKVGSGAVDKLCKMPQMRFLFLWNTSFDSLQVANLQKKYSKLVINSGFKDAGHTMMTLPPPRFEIPSGIIEQPALISLTHAVKGTVIRYTLDGSDPDSINSLVYQKPISIHENTKVNIKAFKDGWYSSPVVKASYLKKGFIPDTIKLLTNPDIHYDNGVAILSDGDLGNQEYRYGQWLAWQTVDAGVELSYK